MRSIDRSSEGNLPKQRQLFHGERKVELTLESLVRWQSSGSQSPGEPVKMKIPRLPYTEITLQAGLGWSKEYVCLINPPSDFHANGNSAVSEMYEEQ